ncbi:MAG: hypothetical protein AB1846_09295 [Chloroflexota bacterium]
MPTNDEQERLKRLRERQLADRDPHVKTRQQQQFFARREKKHSRRKPGLRKMWTEIPNTFRNTIYALLTGLFLLWVVPIFWVSPWALAVVGAATLVLILFGVVLGQAQDSRDEIKDSLRH